MRPTGHLQRFTLLAEVGESSLSCSHCRHWMMRFGGTPCAHIWCYLQVGPEATLQCGDVPTPPELQPLRGNVKVIQWWQCWDTRIVPPIFVWMPESGAADIALDAELDAPHRVRGCAKFRFFGIKRSKMQKNGRETARLRKFSKTRHRHRLPTFWPRYARARRDWANKLLEKISGCP